MLGPNNGKLATGSFAALAITVALGGALCWADAADVVIGQRFHGNYSGVRRASEQVIEDPETWKTVWGQVHGISRPQPELPEIDFDKQSVVAVFLGNRNTGGYSIRIRAIKDNGQQVEVQVERLSPPPGGITTQALTQPYEMVVIGKPGKPVRFVAAE